MHRFEVRVRYADIDQMGWVYYANYLRWFEIGRAEMLRSLGTTYRDVERGGTLLPVLEAHCRYHEGARYDERVVIETGVAELHRASVRFGYRIVRENDGELLANGSTLHCFLGREGRAGRPPEALQKLLEAAPRAEAGSGV
ncbi:MAG TPA: thioesterase family protein [Candidatus Sulfotelmatobacter sp.]|nr:thioesterase family protein [Candidatus Sulfotelmatobacter sp.]